MSLRVLCLLALFCLSLGLSACGTTAGVRTGSGTVVPTAQTLSPPDSTAASGAYTGISEYRVGPQDLVEISVFQVPDLNRTVRVNSSGQISLPLIGVIQAGGLTIQELEKAIAGKLEASYLQNPQVTAFVKEYTSQRVTIEGSVKKPGIYPLSGRTTLLQAIAMAEGMDALADLKGVVIFRQIGGKKMGAVFDMQAVRSGNSEDPLIYGDDIVVVEQSGSKAAMRRFIEATPLFNAFIYY